LTLTVEFLKIFSQNKKSSYTRSCTWTSASIQVEQMNPGYEMSLRIFICTCRMRQVTKVFSDMSLSETGQDPQ
jgi:hypothetical protein